MQHYLISKWIQTPTGTVQDIIYNPWTYWNLKVHTEYTQWSFQNLHMSSKLFSKAECKCDTWNTLELCMKNHKWCSNVHIYIYIYFRTKLFVDTCLLLHTAPQWSQIPGVVASFFALKTKLLPMLLGWMAPLMYVLSIPALQFVLQLAFHCGWV